MHKFKSKQNGPDAGSYNSLQVPVTILQLVFTIMQSWCSLKQIYEDAVELQQYFVAERTKLCKDGERFISPALLVTKRHLQQELDDERKKKVEAENREDERQKEIDKREGKGTEVRSLHVRLAANQFVFKWNELSISHVHI